LADSNCTKQDYHPAVFPEQLANDHIISWSNTGDLVYDPFMGSGTTAKMAILNKRNFVGSEISKEYCDIAEKRISEMSAILF
jgi:site-specific DNA-methyltransferase (adenine-specific)